MKETRIGASNFMKYFSEDLYKQHLNMTALCQSQNIFPAGKNCDRGVHKIGCYESHA